MWDTFLKLMIEPSVITGVLALLTAITVLITVGVKQLGKKKEFDPEDDLTVTHTTPLAKHYVFKILKNYRNIVNDGFDLEGPTRTAAFQEFITNFIDISGNKLYELAIKLDNACLKDKCTKKTCCMDSLDIYKWNKETYESIMHDIASFYRMSGSEYTEQDKIILDYVRDLFSTHCSLGFDFISISIDCIVTNAKYSSCCKQLQANVFSSYQAVFRNLILGTEESFKKTNGFFVDKTFNGKEKPYPIWYKS